MGLAIGFIQEYLHIQLTILRSTYTDYFSQQLGYTIYAGCVTGFSLQVFETWEYAHAHVA